MKSTLRLLMVLLLLVAVVVGLYPATTQVNAGEEISAEDTKPKDPVLIKELDRLGIDKDAVKLVQDYGVSDDNKSPYTQIYKELGTQNYFAVFSRLPQVDAYGDKIEVGWEETVDLYMAENNVFIAQVRPDGRTTIVVKNDQPDGKKVGSFLIFTPQLEIGGVVQTLKTTTLLGVDPLNHNYTRNTLVFDYGLVKRYVRLIEGSFLAWWEFQSEPKGDARIIYNQSGSFRLSLGDYAIGEDEEYITLSQFRELANFGGYPVIIADSQTFYPDANPETSSVDGYVKRELGADGEAWGTLRAGAGTAAYPSTAAVQIASFRSNSTWANIWVYIFRGILLFDTSELDDSANVTGATLSFYGTNKHNDTGSNTPTINVYSSNPASNTNLVAADYALAVYGTTPFSDNISYASYNTSGYNDWILNSYGIASVNLTGVTKLSLREATYDVGNVTPNYAVGISDTNFIGYCAEQGEGYQPKLVVTYTLPQSDPTVVTGASTNITTTTATISGNVTDLGTSANVTVYAYWDTTDHTDNLTAWSNNSTVDTPSQPMTTGEFTEALSSLEDNTLYYYNFYAVGDDGSDWGTSGNFTTLLADPTVVTGASTNITTTTATISGNVTDLGSSVNVTVYAYWDTTDHTDNLTAWSNNSTVDTPSQPMTTGEFTEALSGLIDNTLYYYNFYAVGGSGSDWGTSANFTTVEQVAPIVVTGASSNITGGASTVAGNVTDVGGSANVTVYAYWDTTDHSDSWADWSNNSTVDTPSQPMTTGEFTERIYGLVANTLYYYNFYAVGSAGSAGGSSANFTTDNVSIPEMSTDEVSEYGDTWALLPYDIVDAGGENCTSWGFQYGTEASGVYTANVTHNGSSSVAHFSDNLTGLDEGVAYIFRSFGVNSAGIGYSEEGVYVTTPTVVTANSTSVEETTATLQGNITNTGGENCTDRRFRWGIGTLTDSWSEVGNFGTGNFSHSVSSLTVGALYIVQASVNNSAGWGTGDTVYMLMKPNPATSFNSTDNGTTWLLLGWINGDGMDYVEVRYQEGSAPTDNSSGTLGYWGSGTSVNVTGLDSSTAYYFTIFTHCTGGGLWQTADDNPTCQDTTDTIFAPTVVTGGVMSVEETTATLQGNITSTGGENATDRGFQYGIDTLTDNWTESGNFGTGNFTHGLTSLTKGELYIVRAGANNTSGWGWGDNQTFLTKPDPANSFNVTDNTTSSINLGWINGDGMDYVEVRYSTVSAPSTNSSGTLAYWGSGTAVNITGLVVQTTYYFTIFTHCTEGGLWQTADDNPNCQGDTDPLPSPPTGLAITQVGAETVNLTWTDGVGSTTTYIRVSTSGYPTSITDGYLADNTTLSTILDDGLNLTGATYYYSLWGWNEGGFSTTYTTGRIGGDNMIYLGLIILIGIFVYGGVRSRHPILWFFSGVTMWAFGVYIIINPLVSGASPINDILVGFSFLGGFGLMLMMGWRSEGGVEGRFNIRIPRVFGGQTEEEEEAQRRRSSYNYRRSSYADRLRRTGRGRR